MKPLTKTDLDRTLLTGCGDPTCTSHHEHEPLKEIFLKAKCHPRAGTIVIYHHGGFISVHCAECRRPVVNIAVAP